MENSSRVGVSGPLPDPQLLIKETRWDLLEHALGSAQSVPADLRGLTESDPASVARSFRHLTQTVHHQNSIYSATIPAVLYVAGILPDPRTELKGTFRPNDYPRALRSVLLDWIGQLANDVNDAAVALMQDPRLGPPEEYPEIGEVRSLRPALYGAVRGFTGDADDSVRHSAVIAAVLLLDDARRIRSMGLLSQVREVAENGRSRRNRERAALALSAAGEDVPGRGEEPPF